jgi:hypothetical protein
MQTRSVLALIMGFFCICLPAAMTSGAAESPAGSVTYDTFKPAALGAKHPHGFGLDSFFGAAVLMERSGQHSKTNPFLLLDKTIEALKNNEFEEKAFDVIVFYFARLAWNTPAVLDAFKQRWERADGVADDLLVHILYYAQEKEIMSWVQTTYRETKSVERKETLRELLKKRNTVKINVATFPVGACSDIEMLWAEYLATRDLRAVQRIVAEVTGEKTDPQGTLVRVAAASSLAQRAGWFEDVKKLCLTQNDNSPAKHKRQWQDIIDRLKPLGDGSEVVACPIQRITLDGIEGRAMACGAYYPVMNDGKTNVLGAYSLSCENITATRKKLSEQWSLYGRFELLTSIEWLLNDGHNAGFNAQAKHLYSLEGPSRQVYINRQSERDQARCRIILNLSAEKRKQGIKAWDSIRSTNLARSGYEVQYLSPFEACTLAISIAADLQKTFGSWEECGENFVLGRWYWNGSEGEKKVAENIVRKLLADPDGPWKKYPWDMPLVQDAEAAPQ